jgi:Uma2 family endonuclease
MDQETSMSAMRKPQELFTLDEYFALETSADQRHEYYRGEVFAMSGGSANHNRIAVNLATALSTQLANKPCEVFVTDMRLLVKRRQLYTYPDVMVVCGKVELAQQRTDLLVNPSVIFEVLSPSTETYDRGKKFNYFYRTIDSLQEYVLVDQERVLVEHLRRSGERNWLLTVLDDISDTLSLAAVEVAIPLAEIYRRVEWQA